MYPSITFLSFCTPDHQSQRIGAIIKRKKKERLADAAKQAQKEAMGDYSHLKNKKGELVGKPLPQPTLPDLNIDDDEEFNGPKARSTPAPSVHTQDYYSAAASEYPPPMPQYNPYSNHGAGYNPSQATFGYDPNGGLAYDDDNESQVHLAASAAPIAHQHGYGTPGGGLAYDDPSPAGSSQALGDPYKGYSRGHPGGY